MIARFLENLWRSIGLTAESTVEAPVGKRTQDSLNCDDESDEVIVMEEPLRKRFKYSHKDDSHSLNNSSSLKSLWKSLKHIFPPTPRRNYLELSSHSSANNAQELEGQSGTNDLFDSSSNKENMSTRDQHEPKDTPLSTPLSRTRLLASKERNSLGTHNISSPHGLDPNFRFSPSLTSTIERSTGLGIRKREPIKSLQVKKSDSVLHKQQLYSGVKKTTSPFLKKYLKPQLMRPSDRPFIKSSMGLPQRPPTTKESTQISEKMEYQKMIELYTRFHTLPSTTFRRIGGTPSHLSGGLVDKAFNSGALRLKSDGKGLTNFSHLSSKSLSPCLNEQQSSALDNIRNLMKPTSAPEVIDLASKDDSSSESTVKVPSESDSTKKSDSQDSDIIITKEIIKPFNRIKSPNSIEMKFATSKFYNSGLSPNNRHLSKETRLRLEEHKAELARKSKERNERIRKETSHSKINDVSNRLSSLNLTFPTIYKEVTLKEEEEVKLPELTTQILVIVDKAFRGGPPNQVLANKFNIQITRKDIHTLSGLNWLNDEVINFFMNMIMERGGKNSLPKVYAFNTFFYPKLSKMGYSSVKRWTKKVDIFGHDLLLVPVHLGVHWCMATIDMRDKIVRYYDSMSGDNYRCVQELLHYLESEHMDKKKSPYNISDWKTEIVKDIPQQMNGSDCGMFSCMFAEYLSRNARINFTQENMPYFRKRMVYEIVTQTLMQ